MSEKSHFLVIVIAFVINAAAQQKVLRIPDSLSNRNYTYLREKYNTTKRENVSLLYAEEWLAKSKREKEYSQMALAYQAVMYKSNPQLHLLYADSIIGVASMTGDNVEIGAAYLTKGTIFYGNKNHRQALDNFIMADKYISLTKDDYLVHKVKYTIAQTKYYLGFYHEAIALFKECSAFFRDENDRAYLNSIHNLGLCYNRIGKYSICSEYNRIGLDAGKEMDNTEMAPYFRHSEGINQYFLMNYALSIKLLQQSLSEITARKDFANEIVAWFYLGKDNLSLANPDTAFNYFKKVDGAMDSEKYIRPDLRENYEILIDQYKKEGDLTNQLYYVNRLLYADSILHVDFKYLSGKIHKEYDTRKLLDEKKNIEYQLGLNKWASIISILGLTSFTAYLMYKYYRKIKNYNKKFEELMAGKKATIKPLSKNNNEDKLELDIAPEVINVILKKLDRFELSKKFLEKDMNSARLAELLHTNTKYVSRILPRYRDRNTIDYISDLKIAYIMELLKTEKRYRNYTNKALADTAGFGSTQNFARAFKARTGVSPTFFIHKLKSQPHQDK